MRIEEASLFAVQNRLITPFAASAYASQELTHVLVRLRSGDLVGWGECPTRGDPFYLPETTATAWHIAQTFLLPGIVGKELADVDAAVRTWSLVKGNSIARAGVEMALWDLFGRAAGRSVASMLGGTRTEILSGVSLGIEKDTSRLFDLVDKHLAEGYRRVKLKIMPGYDVPVVEKVRARYPDLPIMVDANGAYTLDDIPHLKTFDRFGLMMIEQPLAWDDYVDHARLQRELTTPICLDESISSAAVARHALELGSCRVMSIKVARVGGLAEAKRIHDACARRNVPVWCGGMHDFGVGRAANVALSTLEGFSIPGDVSGSDKYFEEDVVDPPILATRGAIVPPDRPGLGHDVVESRVLARTTSAWRLRAT